MTKTSTLLKSLVFLPILSLLTVAATAQYTISGKIIGKGGAPVNGASVYLDNTLDGGTSDSMGNFSFKTTEKGSQVLVATEVTHMDAGMTIEVNGDVTGIVLKMKVNTNMLEAVTVTAGSFEASSGKQAVLKPLDIVTTAGAQADIAKAIQTLPGTQQQGAQTGLFVRGGDASEAAVIIDGLTAQNAFLSTAPGVAARSRFSAFQFKGVAFSSGGYSARYGQALSSVLELNSNDKPSKSTLNLGLNMAGVYASGSKVFEKTSIEGSASYTNVSPFYSIAKTNFDFYEAPQGIGASTKFTYTPKKDGIIKALVNYQRFKSGTRLPDPTDGSKSLDFGLTNSTVYSTVSYKQKLNKKWNSYVAVGYSFNEDDAKFDTIPSLSKDYRTQARAELNYYPTTRLSFLMGGEFQHFNYDRTFSVFNTNFNETQVSGYLEMNWTPINWLAVKPGVRVTNSQLVSTTSVAPRLALALRAGLHGQFSIASGMFYQLADPQYYLAGSKPGFQKSVHYIANYQYMHKNRTIRVEAYYKDYDQLIREQVAGAFNANTFRFPNGSISNTGSGYAQGAELFFRDKETVKNGDFWVSYSYIDTRRLFQNYPVEAQPTFIATHNMNVVSKYFIEKLQTQVNLTYNYASGRPYYNPNNTEFLGDRTPDFHNLSMTFNYLTSIKKWFVVVYAGVDNVTNQKNVFGYRYANGNRYPIVPAVYRSVFVGANFSLSAFDLDEL
ncbi:MAG: TonB-dependent receptor [Flavipsychrobacter sp.]